MNQKNIAIFISGTGSNMKSIIQTAKQEKWKMRVAFVLSDNPHALGLQFAQDENIPILVVERNKLESRDDYAQKLLQKIQYFSDLDYIILAGFMQILGTRFIEFFSHKIINIHPSLLPKFPGLNTAYRAIEASEKYHGATIHYVDSGVDTGPIIAQQKVVILDNDTTESLTLKAREIEHELYCGVLRTLLN